MPFFKWICWGRQKYESRALVVSGNDSYRVAVDADDREEPTELRTWPEGPGVATY